MYGIDLYSITHRAAAPEEFGGIHQQFVIGATGQYALDRRYCDMEALDRRYCDMEAPFAIWREYALPPVIGFHGYRKMLNFRDRPAPYHSGTRGWPPSWEVVGLDAFNNYKRWLRDWYPTSIWHDLQRYDIITVEPFNCSYNGNIIHDFAVSRSVGDANILAQALTKRGCNLNTALIRPMHFVMRNSDFCRFMRFWNEVRLEIEPHITSPDAKTPEYKARALAFISERIWSLWLDGSGLRVKTVPLMVCWEAT